MQSPIICPGFADPIAAVLITTWQLAALIDPLVRGRARIVGLAT